MSLGLISERREVMRKAGSRRWRKRDGAEEEEEEEEGGREGREDEGREDEREERTGGQDSGTSHDTRQHLDFTRFYSIFLDSTRFDSI